MWDKIDLRIPLHELYVRESSSSCPSNPVGFVDFRNYGFKAKAEVKFLDGHRIYEDEKVQNWDSIPSSLSTIAVGFYPEGCGFDRWPHIRIKCSPAKILQGHNVFGSENLRPGLFQMLITLERAFPLIYQQLDMSRADVYVVDPTFSARVHSPFFREHIFKLFSKLANSNQKVGRDEGYLLIGQGSRRSQAKIYEKAKEIFADLKKAERSGQTERVKVLSEKRLQDFAMDLMRFEASIKKSQFEDWGIPTNLNKFLSYMDEFEKENSITFCRHLWSMKFEKLFAQLEGQTMTNVDLDKVKLKIDAKLITISASGKLNKRTANSVFQTFKNLKNDGYDQCLKENKRTFLRHIKLLVEECGFSRAYLKSLGDPSCESNVVPIVQLINIDFDNQRPDWYVEPQAGFEDSRTHLRLVS